MELLSESKILEYGSSGYKTPSDSVDSILRIILLQWYCKQKNSGIVAQSLQHFKQFIFQQPVFSFFAEIPRQS